MRLLSSRGCDALDNARRERRAQSSSAGTLGAKLTAPLRRRDFLKLIGVTAGAVASYPLLGRAVAAAAQGSPAVKVLLEDLRLAGPELHAGTLNGVRATPRGIGLLAGDARGQYTSPVLSTDTPFTHVGLRWKAEGASGLSFEIRSSTDGRAWSEWEPVLLEAHTPDAVAQEGAGALVTADRAMHAQFRAVFEGSADSPPLLQDATVTLINSKDGPLTTSSVESSSALPALGSGGQVFSRGEWGADENVRFDSSGNEIWPRMFLPVKKGAVHHTATSNNYNTVEDAKAEVRAIYAYHAVSLGWGDIGYNHLVDKLGNVYEGRYGRDIGGREVLSPGVVAGHATSFNYGSFGVAYLGTCTKSGEGSKPGIDLSSSARTALVDMLAWECDRHDIDPGGASDYLLLNDTWDRGQPNIAGHRDCQGSSTICPGGYIYDQLPSLRVEVAERLTARQAVTASLTPPSVDTVSLDSVDGLQFSWGGSGALSILLEGWRRRVNADGSLSEDVDYLCGFDSDDDGLSDAQPYPDWSPTALADATFGELFALFAPAGAAPVAGHYTFHVIATDGSGNRSYQRDHTLLVTQSNGDGGGNGGITLAAKGYKVKGLQRVDLSWSGAASTSVDVYRGDWEAPKLTANDGSYTDDIDARGGGTYTYKIAEAGTTTFSNEVTVTF